MKRVLIDRSQPGHRCPICHHICHWPNNGPDAKSFSPRVSASEREEIILELLQRYATPDEPLSIEELEVRTKFHPVAVRKIVTRLRQRGFNVVTVYGRGYYLYAREEERDDDSR